MSPSPNAVYTFVNVFSLFSHCLPFERGVALHLNKHESHLPYLKKIFKFRPMYFSYFVIISPWKRSWPFICTNLNFLHPRMFCAQFGWNWSIGSGKRFLYSSKNFFYFVIISPCKKKAWPFIWTWITNLNSHYPRMLCAKLDWNWLIGSGVVEQFQISSMIFCYFVIISPWKKV